MPPIVGPFQKTLKLTLGNAIDIAMEGLHPAHHNRLIRLAAFQNLEFDKAQAMRLSTYKRPRIIACAEDHAKRIGLPRGCLEEVLSLLRDLGVTPDIRDERCVGISLPI